MTVVQAFADFGAKLTTSSLPSDVAYHAKRAVIDWYAALLPGAVEAPARLMEQALLGDLDRGRARLALGRPATARAAALVNGTAAHSVEVDDIYREAIYHPGAPTIAAALAVGQEMDCSGAEFLKAVVAGYEISTRIGAAMGRTHYRYWHNTGTVGTFGAAAAASIVYQLDATRFAHALATCATFAAGLQQAFRSDSMSKPLHAGRAAEGGLLAAQLAAAGVTGSLDVVDGEAGMGHAMSDGPDWTAATQTLGTTFHVNSTTFKNHACCGHTFAPIDGALALQRRMGVTPQQIARIRIATYGPALDVAGNPAPGTAAEARFSLPYVVATALVHGSVRLAAFQPLRLDDPVTRSLMERITLEIDPELDQRFPGQRAARVVIETRDGRKEEFFQPTRKGDPEQPLSDDELGEKFMELASPVVGSNGARSLLRRLWEIDSATSIAELVP